MLSVSPDLLLWPWTRLQSQAPAAPEGGFGSASAPGADWRLEGTVDGLGAGMWVVHEGLTGWHLGVRLKFLLGFSPVALSSAQVEAARKAIRTAQVERYVPEHERCCWCLCCSCEVRKHLSHGNLTVLHGGLLEHLARWNRGWEPHLAFAYVCGRVDLGWVRGRTLLWPELGGLRTFRDRGLMVAMVPHGVGDLTRKASWTADSRLPPVTSQILLFILVEGDWNSGRG